MAQGDNKKRDDVEGLGQPIEVEGSDMSKIRDEAKEAEIRRLTQKADDGALNVVGKILQRPEVQNVIKKNINKQTFISGLFMSFLLVGFFQIFTVMKTVLAYDWRGDLILGVVLLSIGSAYMARQLLRKA